MLSVLESCIPDPLTPQCWIQCCGAEGAGLTPQHWIQCCGARQESLVCPGSHHRGFSVHGVNRGKEWRVGGVDSFPLDHFIFFNTMFYCLSFTQVGERRGWGDGRKGRGSVVDEGGPSPFSPFFILQDFVTLTGLNGMKCM